MNSISIKLEYNNQVHKLPQNPQSFEELIKLISKKYKFPLQKKFQLKYRDTDGDLITIESNEDMQTAFLYLEGEKIHSLKVLIFNHEESELDEQSFGQSQSQMDEYSEVLRREMDDYSEVLKRKLSEQKCQEQELEAEERERQTAEQERAVQEKYNSRQNEECILAFMAQKQMQRSQELIESQSLQQNEISTQACVDILDGASQTQRNVLNDQIQQTEKLSQQHQEVPKMNQNVYQELSRSWAKDFVKAFSEAKLDPKAVWVTCPKCGDFNSEVQKQCKKCQGNGQVRPKERQVQIFDHLFEEKMNLAYFMMYGEDIGLQNKCLKKAQNKNYFIHAAWQCSGCQVNPIVGSRYHCEKCENYNLCESCEKVEVHPHQFMKIDKNNFDDECQKSESRKQMEERFRRRELKMQERKKKNACSEQNLQKSAKRNSVTSLERQNKQNKRDKLKTLRATKVLLVQEPPQIVANPSEQFTSEYVLKNNGTVEWPLNTELYGLGGISEGKVLKIRLALGQSDSVEIQQVAPVKSGRHPSVWRMSYVDMDDGERKFFGPKIVQIVWVKSPIFKHEHAPHKISTGIECENMDLASFKCTQDVLDKAKALKEVFNGDIRGYIDFIKRTNMNNLEELFATYLDEQSQVQGKKY